MDPCNINFKSTGKSFLLSGLKLATGDNAEAGVTDNIQLSCVNLKHVFRNVGCLIFNLCFVMYLENVIKIGMTQGTVNSIIALHPKDKDSFVYKNAFIIFNLMYAGGKSVSLSTLGCFKLEKVWTMSFFMLLNFAFWLSNSTELYL